MILVLKLFHHHKSYRNVLWNIFYFLKSKDQWGVKLLRVTALSHLEAPIWCYGLQGHSPQPPWWGNCNPSCPGLDDTTQINDTVATHTHLALRHWADGQNPFQTQTTSKGRKGHSAPADITSHSQCRPPAWSPLLGGTVWAPAAEAYACLPGSPRSWPPQWAHPT